MKSNQDFSSFICLIRCFIKVLSFPSFILDEYYEEAVHKINSKNLILKYKKHNKKMCMYIKEGQRIETESETNFFRGSLLNVYDIFCNFLFMDTASDNRLISKFRRFLLL